MQTAPAQAPTADDVERGWPERIASGDSLVFDEIVSRYQDRIARLVYRLLGWSDEAEDAIQEVFASVFAKLGQFRGDAQFSTWLTAIALNECRRQRRRRLLRLRTYRRLFNWGHVADAHECPLKAMDFHEHVRSAVSQLPARYLEPIVLRYFEGLSIAQIAAHLRITPNLANVRLHRAREKLRNDLVGLSREVGAEEGESANCTPEAGPRERRFTDG